MSVKGPDHHSHQTTSHTAPVDKKGYSHELHSAALSTKAYAPEKITDDTVDGLMRPLTSRESGVKPLSERAVKRLPSGGSTHLAMRHTLQAKGQARVLPSLAKKNVSPTAAPAA